ncbi:MAG: chromate transporter [Eubacteriaceae bacterium]|jgi:chromate transporter|nr:chromate transporter [Eubacteriaceae bacterium]MDK2904834.1 chromate transporter [Eubacteriaceae bacterium]
MIYINLFITFFKIGLFTIGGGYAMIPLIQQEVLGNDWLTMTEFVNFLAVAESTPGPFAVNIATFIGMELGGIFGAIVTTTAVVLPSLIIIVLIAKLFTGFQDNKWVKGALYGIRPVVIALIASAVVSLMLKGLFLEGADMTSLQTIVNALQFKELLIFAITGLAYFKFKLHPIQLVLLSGGLGIIFFGLIPTYF